MIIEEKRYLFPVEDKSNPSDGGISLAGISSSTKGEGNVLFFGPTGEVNKTGSGGGHFMVQRWRVRVWVKDAAASAGTPDLTFKLMDSLDGSAMRTIYTSPAFKLADLTMGAVIADFIVPSNAHDYLKAELSNSTTSAFTGGKVCGVIEPELG